MVGRTGPGDTILDGDSEGYLKDAVFGCMRCSNSSIILEKSVFLSKLISSPMDKATVTEKFVNICDEVVGICKFHPKLEVHRDSYVNCYQVLRTKVSPSMSEQLLTLHWLRIQNKRTSICNEIRSVIDFAKCRSCRACFLLKYFQDNVPNPCSHTRADVGSSFY